ncbi:tellurium resistance protein [Roseinatronobacter alkalisoli]|uniref:Tellurium resistance protein n=1 Tax=Roseinatronobacter alkalisoli TaxID=3028235 RepID=A0ABT5TBK6_9RHOB|nr:tellurium resistance protein [Roseinatronobacter sp. HJB301]MDD7972510.1 tellurium resistance protein [Roseinatronobacter sp. HJB301]
MTQPRRPMPPPLYVPKPGFGRRTPPAIFAPIMGLFGLGLGWREAAVVFGLPTAVGDMILGAVTLLFLFALVAYLAKPARRAAVLVEDMRVLPGRAGLAAASLSVMLLAASLAQIVPGFATALAICAFVLHLGLVALLVYVLRTSPPEGRVVTPVFHLSFVGFIIGGVAANALGHHDIARAILWAMLIPAGVIWGGSLRQIITRVPPAPLRPLLAIHLAPACLFTIVAHGAGLPGVAQGFAGLAIVIFAALLISLRWLTESGFSPLWGAFTFPLAAFATALLLVSDGRGVLGLGAGVVLAGATVAVPVIAYRVLKIWPGGKLAAKTNAAEA